VARAVRRGGALFEKERAERARGSSGTAVRGGGRQAFWTGIPGWAALRPGARAPLRLSVGRQDPKAKKLRRLTAMARLALRADVSRRQGAVECRERAFPEACGRWWLARRSCSAPGPSRRRRCIPSANPTSTRPDLVHGDVVFESSRFRHWFEPPPFQMQAALQGSVGSRPPSSRCCRVIAGREGTGATRRGSRSTGRRRARGCRGRRTAARSSSPAITSENSAFWIPKAGRRRMAGPCGPMVRDTATLGCPSEFTYPK